MPKLVRLYIRNVLIGFAVAAGFVAILLWLNVANLRHLILASQGGWLALFLLVFFNGIVFAGVQFGIAVMSMAEHTSNGGGRHKPLPMDDALLRIPVRTGEKAEVAGPQRP